MHKPIRVACVRLLCRRVVIAFPGRHVDNRILGALMTFYSARTNTVNHKNHNLHNHNRIIAVHCVIVRKRNGKSLGVFPDRSKGFGWLTSDCFNSQEKDSGLRWKFLEDFWIAQKINVNRTLLVFTIIWHRTSFAVPSSSVWYNKHFYRLKSCGNREIYSHYQSLVYYFTKTHSFCINKCVLVLRTVIALLLDLRGSDIGKTSEYQGYVESNINMRKSREKKGTRKLSERKPDGYKQRQRLKSQRQRKQTNVTVKKQMQLNSLSTKTLPRQLRDRVKRSYS